PKQKNYFRDNPNKMFYTHTRTVTTKQDRNPNAGVISIKDSGYDQRVNKNKKRMYRFLTNREAYKLMGFEDSDFEKIRDVLNNRKDIMYRQAGNSIVVNVLIAIFDYIYKKK